jgi:hypothetical protein
VAANITVRMEQTSFDLLATMDEFFASSEPEDVLLLYYSGHGRLDEQNHLYLCARNTRVDRLRSTAIRSDQVNEMIEGTDARHIVVILDCCHSGAFKGEDIVTPMAPSTGRGRYVIAGCRAGQLANDAPSPNHLSLFTNHLVDGLRNQPAAADGRAFVSLDELYEYVYARVTTSSKQIPQRRVTSQGSLPIAKRARQHRPLRLSRTEIHLDDVQEGELLPPERIRVHGLEPDDAWQVTPSAAWISVDVAVDHFDLHISPPTGRARANVEVFRARTGEAVVVRVRTVTSPLLTLLGGVLETPEQPAPVSAASGPRHARPDEQEPPAAQQPSAEPPPAEPPPAEPPAKAVIGTARVSEAVRAARATVAGAAVRRPRRAWLHVTRVHARSVAGATAAGSLLVGLAYLGLDAVAPHTVIGRWLSALHDARFYPFVAPALIAGGLGFGFVLGFRAAVRIYRVITGGAVFGPVVVLSEHELAGAPTRPPRRARLVIIRLSGPAAGVTAAAVATVAAGLARVVHLIVDRAGSIGWPLIEIAATVAAILVVGSGFNLAVRVVGGAMVTLAESGRRGRRATLWVREVSVGRLTTFVGLLAAVMAGVWYSLTFTVLPGWLDDRTTDLLGAGYGGRAILVAGLVSIASAALGLLALAYSVYADYATPVGILLAERRWAPAPRPGNRR